MKHIIKKIELRHALEVLTYLLVGGSAWVVQTIVYILLVKIAIFPSIAMILGSFSGMVVSYFGHTKYTFKKTHKFSHKEFIKFMVTSIIGLGINVSGVRIITKILLLNPNYAIIPTIFTPAITFIISKFWAFK
jgi:putative flippase GtrA